MIVKSLQSKMSAKVEKKGLSKRGRFEVPLMILKKK